MKKASETEPNKKAVQAKKAVAEGTIKGYWIY